MTITINGITYKLVKAPFGVTKILTYVNIGETLVNDSEYIMNENAINCYCDFENQCHALSML